MIDKTKMISARMISVRQIKNKIIKYIKDNKPVDLWQDKIDMLDEGRYVDFIVYVYSHFHIGKIVDLANELKLEVQTLIQLELIS